MIVRTSAAPAAAGSSIHHQPGSGASTPRASSCQGHSARSAPSSTPVMITMRVRRWCSSSQVSTDTKLTSPTTAPSPNTAT
ncbi:hypothetical protein Ae406Ps2_0927c [Pseudonocardia sp. Ae406_Ps2]|nr:hypothetical protein Ae406Ps2_0927c [Pseudonocardia sp. Ae406_Ps2]OLM07279.1 hypothetical protein Ae331Ps2_4989 [Pseudonocardia sp. Ae331_Ps2]OLM22505.1 hypothetical protein Ae706Ps2_0937c [Pseudonocardia sp. Ae706_Ps2]